jgi:hypothetical protein
MLLPADPVRELASAVALLGFIVLVLEVTKRFYKLMVESGLKHNVAVYYNRKVIHMLGGGVTALLVPPPIHLASNPPGICSGACRSPLPTTQEEESNELVSNRR